MNHMAIVRARSCGDGSVGGDCPKSEAPLTASWQAKEMWPSSPMKSEGEFWVQKLWALSRSSDSPIRRMVLLRAKSSRGSVARKEDARSLEYESGGCEILPVFRRLAEV